MINKNIIQSIAELKYNTDDSGLRTAIGRINERVAYLNTNIVNNNATLLQYQNYNKSYEAEIEKITKDKKEAEEKLSKGTVIDPARKKELNNIYSKLKKLPIKKMVSFTSNGKPAFFILTDFLTCDVIGNEAFLDDKEFQEAVGKDLGEFVIRYDSGTGYLRAFNLTQRASASYDLPTINCGSLCLGTLGGLINKCHTDKNLYGLIDLVIDFIRSPSYNGPYIHWNDWRSKLSKPIYGEMIQALNLTSDQQNVVNNLLGEKKNCLMGETKVVYSDDDDEYTVATLDEVRSLSDENELYDVVIYSNDSYRDLGDCCPSEI